MPITQSEHEHIVKEELYKALKYLTMKQVSMVKEFMEELADDDECTEEDKDQAEFMQSFAEAICEDAWNYLKEVKIGAPIKDYTIDPSETLNRVIMNRSALGKRMNAAIKSCFE